MLGTNHRGVEKALILRENKQQTIRTLLGQAYINTEPALTEMMIRMHKSCPELFKCILLRSEHYFNEPDEDEMYVSLLNTPNHENPRAFACISRWYAQHKLDLPLWPAKLLRDNSFLLQLREAYIQDYKVRSFVEWGRSPLQWCTKFSFTNRYERILSNS